MAMSLAACKNRPRLLSVPLIFVLWLFLVSRFSTRQWAERPQSPQHQGSENPTSTTVIHKPLSDGVRAAFITSVLNSTVTGEFNGTAIKAWCDAQKIWTNDIALDAVIYGGIGNVRNDVISTVRYAIEAGVGIISPVIQQRDSDLIKINTGNGTDLSYLFDQEIFESRLRWACPQMPIYKTLEEFENLGPMTTMATTPRNLPQDNGPVTSIKSDLTDHRGPVGGITRAVFLSPLGYLPICVDGAAFADNIGQLIPFRKDAQYLAAAVLYELSTRFNIVIDPNNGIAKNTFFGVHLRTEVDAAAAGFPGYEDLAPHYLYVAASLSLPVAFMASGDPVSSARFIAEAAALSPPITVVTKHDLLSGADLEQLKALNWDQQALVDYLVLLRSSYFSGVARSSFSANIAMRRRVLSKTGSCGEGSSGVADDVAFRDEFSDLVGSGPTEWAEKMWP